MERLVVDIGEITRFNSQQILFFKFSVIDMRSTLSPAFTG